MRNLLLISLLLILVGCGEGASTASNDTDNTTINTGTNITNVDNSLGKTVSIEASECTPGDPSIYMQSYMQCPFPLNHEPTWIICVEKRKQPTYGSNARTQLVTQVVFIGDKFYVSAVDTREQFDGSIACNYID